MHSGVASLVRSCSSAKKPIIHKVRIRPDENGSHWGWWSAERQTFTMIWRSKIQLDMCFAYGPAAEKKRGGGLRCRLAVEMIADASDEE